MNPMTMFTVASTMLGAAGQFQAGEAAEQSAEFTAQQEEAQGVADYASATRVAGEEARKGRLVASAATAAAAAGGGSASDPGAIKRLGDIGSQTEYNVLSAMFEGETAQAGAKTRAEVTRRGGQQAKRTARMKGLSTIIKGGSKAYKSYSEYLDESRGYGGSEPFGPPAKLRRGY